MTLLILALAVAVMAAAYTTTPGTHGKAQVRMQSRSQGTINFGAVTRCLARLKLTATQKQQINTIRQNGRRDMTNIRSNRSLTAAQKNTQIRAAQTNEINRIMGVLTPTQRTQFRNCITIRTSMPGTRGAATTPKHGAITAVRDLTMGVPGVTLTATQKQRIVSIRTRMMSDIRAVNSNTSLTTAQKTSRIAAIHARTNREVLALLTATQRRQYNNWLRTHGGSTSY